MKTKNTSWGDSAEWYNRLLEIGGDTYQAKVILPNLLRLLDPKPKETILDIACGQGYFARAVAARGARVIGADIAPELIKLAREQSPKTIDYHVAPANSLGFIENGAAEGAILVLALQNIEDLQGTLKESARVLRPGGRLVVVLNHPAFRIPGRTSWQWDEKDGAQYRRIDAYLSDSSSKIQMHPGEHPEEVTLAFHRPLQAYFKALEKSGFAVTRLEEWISHKKSQAGPRSLEEDRARKEIPLFLALLTVKLGQ